MKAVGLAMSRPASEVPVFRVPHNLSEISKVNPIKTHGLKDGIFVANVHARNEARPTDKSAGNVGDDVAVQVGHEQNASVELLGAADKLHASIVDWKTNHKKIFKMKTYQGVELKAFAFVLGVRNFLANLNF